MFDTTCANTKAWPATEQPAHSPSDDVYDVFEERLFSGHPLSGPILGTAESVSAITSEELRKFRAQFFTPGRMTLSIVSPLEEKDMERIALRQIAKWSKLCASTSSPQRQSTTLTRGKGFDITEKKDNHEANCIIGNLAPNMYDRKNRYATVLLCNMLGGPSCNSILGSQLREKHGWVYNVECMFMPYSDNGIVSIVFGCEKKNLAKCKRAIRHELDKLCEKPLSEKKLAEAKKQILGQHAISMENGEAQCIGICKTLSCHGEVREEKQIYEEIMGVTADRVLELCRQIFDPEKMCTLTYL